MAEGGEHSAAAQNATTTPSVKLPDKMHFDVLNEASASSTGDTNRVEENTTDISGESAVLRRQVTIRPMWPYGEWECVADGPNQEQTETAPKSGNDEVNTEVVGHRMPVAEAQCSELSICTGPDSNAEKHSKGFEYSRAESSDSDASLSTDHVYEVTPVAPESPIQCLFNFLLDEFKVDGELAEKIQKDLTGYMEDTLEYLQDRYDIFENSSMKLVGSVAETSKIHRPDEFDFAVVLPALANESVYRLLFREDSMLQDERLIRFVQDMQVKMNDKEVLMDFHIWLNVLFHIAMNETIPPGWVLKDSRCHVDYVSVAATYHLLKEDLPFPLALDICFLIPLNVELLNQAPDHFIHRDFLLQDSVDNDGFVYAILSRDEDIVKEINQLRFAASTLERNCLMSFGPDSNRLRCYRLLKCIASLFLPKLRKREDCEDCVDALVSSFCLKQILMYMIANHKSDTMWTDDQLPNRVVEAWMILWFCLFVNVDSVAAYFYPYSVSLSGVYEKFDPSDSTLVHKSDSLYQVMENGERVPFPEKRAPCLLPDKGLFAEFFKNDPISLHFVEKYFDFLTSEPWNTTSVIETLLRTLESIRYGEESE